MPRGSHSGLTATPPRKGMSVPYAVARIHTIERNRLDTGQIERLLAAATYGEALRVLAEIGFLSAEGGDAEMIAAERVRSACALVRKISPDPNATDCFMLRYDGLNLKTLLKARCLNQPAAFLSPCGVYPVDRLAHMVAERQYKKLPEALRAPLDALEKKLAVRDDALAIDAAADKAVYALIRQKLRFVKSRAIRAYFAERADILGAVMLLRARRMGRDAAFFSEMLLPGGTIREAKWLRAFENPDLLEGLLAACGKAVKQAAAAAVQDAAKLPALEKAMEDHLIAKFTALRHDCLRIEPVIGHILGAEKEAAAVRLILAGKKNAFPPEAIRERLRVLYGE
ncbi:MAG: V-type ATPase subunit [Firmicutes bacterium]|nr:V-type ATPase subunit [Bacillota bacterium]